VETAGLSADLPSMSARADKEISIILSVRNGMPYLAEAVRSIERARHQIELIVIDAGSTDGSLELAREQHGAVVMSRPGLPLYAAWNLGISLAKGDYVGFLNADDAMMPEVLFAGLAEDSAAGRSAADIRFAATEAWADDGREQALRLRFDGALADPSLDVFVFGSPAVNGKLYRRSLFERIGGFDERYALAADRDFLLRCLAAGAAVTWQSVPGVGYRYRIHGGSKTLAGGWTRRLAIAEEHIVLAQNWLADAAAPSAIQSAMRDLLVYESIFRAMSSWQLGRLVAALRQGALAVAKMVSTANLGWRAFRCRRKLRHAAVASAAAPGRGPLGTPSNPAVLEHRDAYRS
jgi:glycosyltransferase involved in cell wall biosynthesis